MDKDLHVELSEIESVEIPEEYCDHPLLNQPQPFFTLPSGLWQWLTYHIRGFETENELWEMETDLSDVCEDHSSRIGFWHRHPIAYQLLRRFEEKPIEHSLLEKITSPGKTTADTARALDLANERLEWAAEVRRGYCGWLMTNRMFLQEQQALFETWQKEVAAVGIPTLGSPLFGTVSQNQSEEIDKASGKTEQLLKDFEAFFIRWRLDGMPAPDVPQPIGVHLPVIDLRTVLGHLRHGGTSFYIPDIFPLPSHDELRNILEESIRNISPVSNETPSHLREWISIVKADQAAKNQIPRYGRIFEIQHYMRALYARHISRLNRKKTAVIKALAEFFGVSQDTLERDVQAITKRLGTDWHLPSA